MPMAVLWENIELPGFDRGLTHVEPGRREAFAAHLESVMADLSSSPISKPDGPDDAERGSSVFSAACTACRGYCCRGGGDTGYLDREALEDVWNRLPHLSKRELLSAYIDAVPNVSFENSCIFHAEHGCALPRTMRPPICVAHLCWPLRRTITLASGELHSTQASQQDGQAPLGT